MERPREGGVLSQLTRVKKGFLKEASLELCALEDSYHIYKKEWQVGQGKGSREGGGCKAQ
jgi:hypothetical protein